MIQSKDYLAAGLQFHGHKCPAMPMGLRAGAAAMNRLGVARASDGELLALIEQGENHCATCFADGVQMITGCTLGKGNLRRLDYGKWALTLIDRKTGRAVRVSLRPETMKANKESDFLRLYRQKGVPASQVPDEVVQPLVERVMNAPEEALFQIGGVFNHPVSEQAASFASFACECCGEMVAEPYGRIRDGKRVCLPCQVQVN